MSVREYIGARYVPVFADPIEWDNTKTYEPLTIVYYQGNSFTSRQAVPAGIDITNETYWAETGNYNAQVEQYRTEVLAFDGRIDTLEDDLPTSSFDSTNTVKKAIDDTNDLLPASSFSSVNTVKAYIDSEISGIGTTISGIEDDIEELQQITTPYNYKNKKFVFIGDSITIGQSGTSPATFYDRPWAKTLCNITGASYHNFSAGGATFQNTTTVTTENFDAQINNVISSNWSGHNPDYIFIMLGTNDYGVAANPGNLQDAGSSSYATVSSAMITGINTLRTAYPTCMIIGVIPPFMPGDVTRNGANFTAMDYKTVIKNMYDILNVPTIDFTTALSANESNWNAHIWDTTSPRLHPNQATHDLMGTIAAASLPSLCNRMYTLLTAQSYGGSLTMQSGVTGSIAWWIDEQNNVHFFTQGVNTPNDDTTLAVIPEILRPMFDFYDYAINLNGGDAQFIYILSSNGKICASAKNKNLGFHIVIPQMLRHVNTGNVRSV